MSIWLKRYRESQKGFTLIELMATLAILAMVVAIAVPAVGKIMDNAEAQARDSSIALIESSGELAYLGGLDFDDNERKSYDVPTLVSEGYLTLSEDDALYDNQNYVYQTSTGAFKFNGDDNQEEEEIEEEIEPIPEPEPNPETVFAWGDNGDGTATITGYTGERLDVVIPDTLDGLSVTSIGGYAFWDIGISSVDIPDSVASIGDGAFYGNLLTSIDIPVGVTSIGVSAFYGNLLTSIDIPVSVMSIGEGAFENNNLTTVYIPDSAVSISNFAFRGNALTKVYIPVSVTSIGRDVFVGNSDGMIIHGVSGSTAQSYASSYGYEFESID